MLRGTPRSLFSNGPNKSMARSDGNFGLVIGDGMMGCETRKQSRQFFANCSAYLSIIGHQTLIHKRLFMTVSPGCPSCAKCNISFSRDCGIIFLLPLNITEPLILIIFKIASMIYLSFSLSETTCYILIASELLLSKIVKTCCWTSESNECTARNLKNLDTESAMFILAG